MDSRLSGWDAYVFQKAYKQKRARKMIEELAARRERTGENILVLDMCDPDWLAPEARRRLMQVIHYFDFATCPTEPLKAWLEQYLPTFIIPDGVKAEALIHKREKQEPTPSVCWVGYRGNAGALAVMGQALSELDLEVEVVALDRPVPFEVWLKTLTRYDILLNPRPNVSPYKYKSDNKSLIAWASGVAVAETGAELKALMNHEDRIQRVQTMRSYVLEQRTAKISAKLLSRRLARRYQ
jgi:hypothetical protein